jgi:benzoyl-CoA reductase subunit C
VQSDRSRFNLEAARFLAAGNPPHAQHLPSMPKAFLCGCAVDGRETYDLIESCGIRVIADDLCTGLRHFNGLVDATLDPLRGIARRYLQRAACARMEGAAARAGRVMQLADDCGADGIIFLTLKFCDLVQSDLPRIRETAHGKGMPLLHLERESLNGHGGPLRTRIQAFAEMMTEKRR